MADSIALSDCLVPFGWKKEQDAYEREHGAEKAQGSTPRPYPAEEYPRLPLAKAARLAREAGMNYGEYMAKRGIFPPPPGRRKSPLKVDYSQVFVKRCEVCGKPLTERQRKYCHECKKEEYLKSARERNRQRRMEGEDDRLDL